MVTKLSLGFSIRSLFFKQLTFIIHETNHIDENLQTVVTHKVYILSNSNTQTCIINSKIPPKKKKKTHMEKVSTNRTYKHQSCATQGKLLQLNLTNYSLNKENKEYPLRKSVE